MPDINVVSRLENQVSVILVHNPRVSEMFRHNWILLPSIKNNNINSTCLNVFCIRSWTTGLHVEPIPGETSPCTPGTYRKRGSGGRSPSKK